jgi:RNA polymerase sigma factor (sigma-70 family)
VNIAESGRQEFGTTNKELLQRAAVRGAAGEQAREEFAKRYYAPVLAFTSRMVRDQSVAEDLAQRFLTEKIVAGTLLESHGGNRAFRPYLKRALANHVRDHWRREARDGKRFSARADAASDLPPSGAIDPSSGDAEHDPSDLWEAERAFHRAWVEEIVNVALMRVSAVDGQSMDDVALLLRRYVGPDGEGETWDALCTRFGITEKTARKRVERVKKTFTESLHAILSERLGSAQAVDEELAILRSLL